jgi:hypothetical protein
VLSYELVRTTLRDNRFQIPPGYILAVQGITSGPLWDKVVNSLLGMEGAQHQRVRSVASKAFTPPSGRASTRHDRGCDRRNSLNRSAVGVGSTPSSRSRGPTPCPSSAPCSARLAKTGNSFHSGQNRHGRPTSPMQTTARRGSIRALGPMHLLLLLAVGIIAAICGFFASGFTKEQAARTRLLPSRLRLWVFGVRDPLAAGGQA